MHLLQCEANTEFHYETEALLNRKPVSGRQGDGSVDKVLATEAQGLKFKGPDPTSSWASLEAAYNPRFRDQIQRIPGASQSQ